MLALLLGLMMFVLSRIALSFMPRRTMARACFVRFIAPSSLFVLLIDFTVFSNTIYAYTLVCGHVMVMLCEHTGVLHELSKCLYFHGNLHDDV